MVELRTGPVWEVPYINWNAIPGCWTNHRKRTGVHCRRTSSEQTVPGLTRPLLTGRDARLILKENNNRIQATDVLIREKETCTVKGWRSSIDYSPFLVTANETELVPAAIETHSTFWSLGMAPNVFIIFSESGGSGPIPNWPQSPMPTE